MSEYMSEIMSAGGDYSKKYILNYFKGSGSNTGAAQNGSRIWNTLIHQQPKNTNSLADSALNVVSAFTLKSFTQHEMCW